MGPPYRWHPDADPCDGEAMSDAPKPRAGADDAIAKIVTKD
ncbi:MAG: hypothetical protein AAGA90_08020 [Actinomycetota bacterium]